MSILLKPHKIQMYAGEAPINVYDFDFSILSSVNIDYLKRIQELQVENKRLEGIITNHHKDVLDIAEGKK